MNAFPRHLAARASARPAPLWPTLLACLLLLLGFGLATARLTAGFEQWTFEGLRRLRASQGALRWPAHDLVDSAGQALHLPAGGGAVMLVDFVYTGCEAVCQSLGAEFLRAQQILLNAERGRAASAAPGVRLLSVSIDPARDTPQALAAYAARHHADPAVWRIAAPRTVGEGRRTRQALGVIAVPDGLGGFAHNGSIHVIDRTGRVAAIFDTTDWLPALQLAQRLQEAAP